MPNLHLSIVTAERKVLDQRADMVIAPGGAGELGILPRHIPLITTLKPGELRVLTEGSSEESFAVLGGFMEVRNEGDGSAVIVLADSAERAEDIDLARAEEARRRAEQRIAETGDVDSVRAQAALLRAITRIRVAERRRSRAVQRQ